MEVVQLGSVATIYGPGFTSIQQGWNHYSLVNLYFGLKSDWLLVPNLIIESVKRCTKDPVSTTYIV